MSRFDEWENNETLNDKRETEPTNKTKFSLQGAKQILADELQFTSPRRRINKFTQRVSSTIHRRRGLQLTSGGSSWSEEIPIKEHEHSDGRMMSRQWRKIFVGNENDVVY